MNEPTQAPLLPSLRDACAACFGTIAVWPLIEHAYSEPHRFYHTLEHLAELFDHLAPYRGAPLWPAIELAVWGHDVVYVTELPDYADNEVRSAQWLARVVEEHCTASWRRAHAPFMSLAGQFIVATKTHRLPDHLPDDASCAAQLFLDADLAILAADEVRLLRYDEGIAREWRQPPDAPSDAFRNGRRQALEQLLAHEPLFLSTGFAPLAAPARANLQRLLHRYS